VLGRWARWPAPPGRRGRGNDGICCGYCLSVDLGNGYVELRSKLAG